MAFHGIIPAVTTPFTADDHVDVEGLVKNVEFVIDGGVHAIVGCGTMGESGSLSRAERAQVLSAICSAAGGRVPVVAGIAAQNEAIASEYIIDAREAGVAGFMVLPPLLYRGDDRELAGWFRAICDVAELPVVLYNNPSAAGYDLSAETIIRIASEVEGLVQVKECSGDVRRIPEIIHGSNGRLEVLVGGDDWAFEGMCVGANGWISGVADVLPAQCVQLYELVQSRDLDAARELYGRLLPMGRFDMTPKLVQYYKAGMDEVGLAGGATRPPRLPLTDAEQSELRAALALVTEHAPV